MKPNVEKMREIARSLYVTHIQNAFGDSGVSALEGLMQAIISLYKKIDPGTIGKEIFIFFEIASATVHPKKSKCHKIYSDVELIPHECLRGEYVFEARLNGEIWLYDMDGINIEDVSQYSVVYRYKDRTEAFIAKGKVIDVLNPISGLVSIFSRPTFNDLRSALESYSIKMAYHSTCHILKGTWWDSKRLFLSNKPESKMRQSLSQYLLNVLSDAEVRPEQIVDESHPVDIKVTWVNSLHRALIEIKWLGDSKDDQGNVSTKYRESRAKSGAKQLADYLDLDKQFAPHLNTRGYLVVFDARRAKLNESMSSISSKDGMHFAAKGIAYKPEYHKIRGDFEEPIRVFSAPVCN